MGRLGLAFKLFFRVLGDADLADRVRPVLDVSAPAPTNVLSAAAPSTPAKPPAPARSEAIGLLAVLQREARLVDFLLEPIAAYSNDQIGAAVRDVHREAAATLEKVFALRPVLDQPEGSIITLNAAGDSEKIRLIGNVAGKPPFSGAVRHPGWQATRAHLPEWSGSPDAARVVAPAEVEIP